MNQTSPAADTAGPPLSELPPFPSWPESTPQEEAAVLEVLRSGAWGSTSGEVVQRFEREFAATQQAKHAIAVSNGTLALVAALRAAGVGVGDEVIVPPYTFIATAAAALFIGAIPVFADVDPDTHLIDAGAVERAVTERTAAIIAVHLAGSVADVDTLNALARRHQLCLVEDAAQAVGASWSGRRVGAIGTVGTFSFQSSKNMTAGEGGIVVTDDDALADRLYSLVNVGRVRGGGWYQHDMVGYNLRLTEFQGAILRCQLGQLREKQAQRDRNARLLTQLLAGLDDVRVDPEPTGVSEHGRHLFMLRLPELGRRGLRDELVQRLHRAGVDGASTGYVPLHRNEALLRERAELAERLGVALPEEHCPVADLICTDTVWLPQRILLASPQHIRAVATAFAEITGELRGA